ncbi:MAG: dihydroorotase [Clostridiales bacterium]|nr:dihydroorotase [Clostridiales bacterium]
MLIKNAEVFSREEKSFIKSDVLIIGGLISKIDDDINFDADLEIRADGLFLAPGLVDIHVHTRDPGFTYKDDILTVADCAVAGGVTTIVAMPNTKPTTDNETTIKYICDKSKKAKVKVLPCASVSHGLKGEEAVNFESLIAAGACAFSDDGEPVSNAKMLAHAMLECEKHNSIIFAHCEDKSLVGKGIVNEGPISERLSVEGIPISSESVGVAREIALAKSLGARIHICHVSTKDAIDIIRSAKADGVRVTAETAPHYFVFTEENLLVKDADFRMNPPLRRVEDRAAIIEALQDGTLDLIATDHAPHTVEEKSDFEKAPNGVVGLETSLAAGITYLVKAGHIDMYRLIELMSTLPAAILGLPEPAIAPGETADLVLFDPDEEWTVSPEKLAGKSKNTPFKGMKLIGKVKHTICAGKMVYNDNM